jgi:hypothetical protein
MTDHLAIESPRPSVVLAGICHDIGLATVASELGVPLFDGSDPELREAVKRGVSYQYLYVYLTPKSDRDSVRQQ